MQRSSEWTCVSLLMWVGVAAGCDAARTAPPDAVRGAAEGQTIGASEQPEALVANASRRLADNISTTDIGRDFGVPDARVPYPDTYWPFVYQGTAWRWNPSSYDPRSPLEKFMAVTNPYATYSAQTWEFQNHGTGVPRVANWYGHCPGWVAAAMLNRPILHPVYAQPDGAGGIAPCNGGSYGCTRFEIGDINALMAEVYLDGPASFIGAICATPPYSIPRDRYGRILKDGCDGINAGTFLVTAATLLKKNHVPFAIDAQTPTKTAEIWNQPAYRYHVYDFRPLATAAAANLVAHGSTRGSETAYRWNADAKGFAYVDLGLRWVGETNPNLNLVSGVSSSHELRVAAVIELDADASDPSTSIIGGEYLDLPSVRADRLTVSPFLWVAHDAGADNLPLYSTGEHHNPFIIPSVVKQLIALGQQ